MKKIVIFASGSGTNFQAVIDAVARQSLHACVSGLVTDNPQAGAIERAKKSNIPVKVLRAGDYPGYEAYTEALIALLDEWEPDLIVLAGYLKKIPVEVIRRYPNRIINIHPSLLPKYGGRGFYGIKVHQAVIAAAEKESGCSVHLVTEHYDEGPVLAQTRVNVSPDDTPESLQRKILEQEHQLLPRVIHHLLTSTSQP